MGLWRRKSSGPRVGPITEVSIGRASSITSSPPVDMAVVHELREVATTAANAAERATELAEQAQRQALLAMKTAGTLTPSSTSDASVDHIAALTSEIERLATLVRGSIDESRHARELVASLDDRITRMGVELAHQIDELSGDVDALSSSPESPEGDVVADLRSGQVRLAHEQARYQIAFRAELAAIADEVRRRPSR
jgi:hypothetical protein